MTHWLAKLGGWAFFGLTLVSQLTQTAPHTLSGWLQTIGAGIAAIGIHAASNTDGTK